MLQEQPPPLISSHPPARTPGPPPAPPDHQSVPYALAWFILGAMVGLLSIMSRIAHELQSALLSSARLVPLRSPGMTPSGSSLPPMIADLDDGLVRLIAFGFVVCGIVIFAGASLWFAQGKPDEPYERRWTGYAALITLMLLIGAGAALFVPSANARLILLIVPSVVALISFVALVILVLLHTLNAPP